MIKIIKFNRLILLWVRLISINCYLTSFNLVKMTQSLRQLIVVLFFFTGINTIKSQSKIQSPFKFESSNTELQSAVKWAKQKALSYAHDDSDPVGYWYEAALPNREAFCMRDVSHQSIGAEILGLSKHNKNMLLKFAQNISESKDYASYWEINRYNKPAPVDYENDQDFWYNLPANFDVIYTIERLYHWTKDTSYLNNKDFEKFCSLSLNEYVDRWELSHTNLLSRNRSLFVQDNHPDNRFGKNRGIPTYNEGGRGESLLGIDMTASYIAGLNSYSKILRLQGRFKESELYIQKMEAELSFLKTFWWDNSKQAYRSIQYKDQSFDYFMVGKNQAFLHYLLYFNVLTDSKQIDAIVEEYKHQQQNLIVELKSYLPIIFYENNHSNLATKMIIELCGKNNLRRDYPENSFTIIEHITRGLMGIIPSENAISTLSRLDRETEWASVEGVSIQETHISVKHIGKYKTIFSNQGETKILWKAQFKGNYEHITIQNKKLKAQKETQNGKVISYIYVPILAKEKIIAEAEE